MSKVDGYGQHPLREIAYIASKGSRNMLTFATNRNSMKKLFGYFLQGLLLVTPTALTIFIVYWVFDLIDGPIRHLIFDLFKLQIPGAGLIITFFFIALIGWIGHSFLFKPIGLFFEKVFERIPILKMIYTSVNDFLNAFVGEKKKFTRPVIVKVNLVSNLEKIGFITTEDLSDLGCEGKVAVLFPHSYNWSGELFIVPKEHVRPLNIPPGEVMKFAVTGGVTRV
jgi:uncharacterized membrane protein